MGKWEPAREEEEEKHVYVSLCRHKPQKNMASAFDRALRRPDSVIYLFISRPAPSLLGPTAALCANGAGPAGTPPGRGPVSAGFGRRGAACVLPSLPPAPLFSPRLVTIRRNVVAGSMTPWVEAASPLSSLLVAAGSGRAARACAGATCRGQGRSAALSPRPAQVPGRPRGEGLGVAAGSPAWLSAAGRPTPAARLGRPQPTFTPGTAAGAVRLPHERSIFVGVAASLWLPQDLVASPLQTCPFAQPLCTRLRRRR